MIELGKKKPTNKFCLYISNFLELVPLDYVFAALCAGFCFASFCTLLLTSGSFTDISFVLSVNTALLIVITAVVFALLIILAVIAKIKTVIPLALLISAAAFGCALAFYGADSAESHGDNIYLCIGIAVVMFFIASWVCKDDKLRLDFKLPKHTEWIVAGVLLVLFTVVVSAACIARYNAYFSHNFDFGIFAQMFENMRTTGLPNTTVERNTLMSHFGVHFSPFYYVLLPFYALCPRPEALFVIQAAFVAAGIIPVVLICKKYEFSQSMTIACSLVYILFPSLANGCLYDFHENKFLTVLIMWALYFIVSDRRIGTIVFCALILTVKEDAAIYVMAIALYIMFTRKHYIFGGSILAVALVYFVIASNVVAALGNGVMTGRLENYMPQGQNGFGAVIKTCLTDFGYLISQVFTAEKIMFMVWMLLPVAFAPFIAEQKSMLVLLIPMLVIDLMSNWIYQYDIDYQYTFGVAALVIFMMLAVLSQVKKKTRNKIVIFSLSMCMVMSCSLFLPRSGGYFKTAENNKTNSQSNTELIESIPTDVEITADGFYIPHMYNFKNLYQYPNYYSEQVKTEYLLVSQNKVNSNTDNLQTFIGNDYTLVKQAGDMCLYQLKN